MEIIVFLLVAVAVAVIAPLKGTDSTPRIADTHR